MRQRQIETQKLLNEYYEANPGPTVALVEALTAALAANQSTSTPDRSVANAGFSGGREAAIGNTSDNNDKFHEALGIE